MGKVISIINMKGGVGKTTLSIGISDYLAEIGKKVLLIDADPQFNATQALLDQYKPLDDDYYNSIVLKNNTTIFKIFTAIPSVTELYECPKIEALKVSLTDNLDLICGDLRLVLPNNSNNSRFAKRIKGFIRDNKLKDKYDFIFIDCPPTLTIYTDSALIASDYYLIPNRIDRYSIIGIESLQSAITGLIREEELKLKCLGIVYTMVYNKTLKKQESLRQSFESKKALDGIDIFSSKTTFYKTVQFAGLGSNPNSYFKAKQDIVAVSEELIERLKKEEDNVQRSGPVS